MFSNVNMRKELIQDFRTMQLAYHATSFCENKLITKLQVSLKFSLKYNTII